MTNKKTFTRASIEAKIADLEKKRDDFVMQANQEIAALNGAIRVLAGLLDGDEPAEAKE